MCDCAIMGVDWRVLSWWEYQALLNRWNARNEPAKPNEPTMPANAARIAEALRHSEVSGG